MAVDPVAEIKSRLSIEDLVSQYVALKKAGKNFKGLCPFHSEKSPSFVVSPEKQLAWCFGCQKGGDIFAFIQEVEGVDFSESLKILADKANVELKEQSSAQHRMVKSQKEKMLHACDQAQEIFVNNLWSSKEGVEVLNYVRNRGITDEMIRHFGIGFAKDSFDFLHSTLMKRGVEKNTLVQMGLSIAKDTSGNRIYDRFRNRLMFPLRDSLGRIVACAGRVLDKEAQPKYMNSPESVIYNKSEVLYGYSDAKAFIKEKGEVVVVEGYFDVIASYQAGVKNVVATCGTALTLQHLKLLQRVTKKIIFAFDTDNAGVEAAYRAVQLAQELPLQLKIAAVSSGKDPADLVQENPDEWITVVDYAVPYLDFFLKYYGAKIDRNSYEGQRELLDVLFPLLQGMKSRVEQDYALRKIASELHLSPQVLYDEFQALKLPRRSQMKNKEAGAAKKPHSLSEPEYALGLLLSFAPQLGLTAEMCDRLSFSEELQNIYKLFRDHYNFDRAEFDKHAFMAVLSSEERRKFDLLTLYIEERYRDFSAVILQQELKDFVSRIQTNRTLTERKALELALKEAERTNDVEKIASLLHQIQNTFN